MLAISIHNKTVIYNILHHLLCILHPNSYNSCCIDQPQLQNSHQLHAQSPNTSNNTSICLDPLPLTNTVLEKAPSPNETNKDSLLPIDVVLKKYDGLVRSGPSEGNVQMLTVKLAKEAMFGVDVMRKCMHTWWDRRTTGTTTCRTI